MLKIEGETTKIPLGQKTLFCCLCCSEVKFAQLDVIVCFPGVVFFQKSLPFLGFSGFKDSLPYFSTVLRFSILTVKAILLCRNVCVPCIVSVNLN